MEFIKAQRKHLDEICHITDQAKAQLKSMGVDQWQKGYPSRQVWENDIACQSAWIAIDNEQVLAVFAFQTEPDPSYGEIDGEWLTDTPYASMHRVCVSDSVKGRGVAGKMFAFGFYLAKQLGFRSVRIDTHSDNLPMQRALLKAGFSHCGKITLKGGCENGDTRIAFERIV